MITFRSRRVFTILLSCMAFLFTPAAHTAPKKKNPGLGPQKWEQAIKQFEAADAARPPAKAGILLVGGSNARRWTDVAACFPGHQVLNRGFGGAKLEDVLFYTDRIVLPYAPKVILLNAGGNDLSAGRSPEQIRDNARNFLTRVHAALPETRVFIISLPPVRKASETPGGLELIRGINRLLAELAGVEKNTEFIDLLPAFLDPQGRPRSELFAEDGVHFSPRGYEELTGLLRGKF